MSDSLPERRCLLVQVFEKGDGPEQLFNESRRVRISRQTQDTLLNVGREAEEHEDLRDPGTAQPLAAGDFGLAGDLPDVEFLSPRNGLAEGLHHGRGPGLPWRLGPSSPASALGDSGDHLVGGHAARQAAKTALLKGPVRSEGHLHLLFVIGGRTV